MSACSRFKVDSIKSFIFVEALLVELILNFVRNFSKTVFGIQRQQLPGQTQRVIEISTFVLSLRNELMLKLLEKLQMGEILFRQGLSYQTCTSSPMTAFIAAVSFAAA